MSKKLTKIHNVIVKLNECLDNKVFSQEEIEQDKQNWNYYLEIMDDIETLLDKLKNTSPENLLKDDSTLLSTLCSYIGAIDDDLYILQNNLIKIIQAADRQEKTNKKQ